MWRKRKLTQPQIAILSLSIKPMSMNFLQQTETSKQTPKETSTIESFIITVVD